MSKRVNRKIESDDIEQDDARQENIGKLNKRFKAGVDAENDMKKMRDSLPRKELERFEGTIDKITGVHDSRDMTVYSRSIVHEYAPSEESDEEESESKKKKVAKPRSKKGRIKFEKEQRERERITHSSVKYKESLALIVKDCALRENGHTRQDESNKQAIERAVYAYTGSVASRYRVELDLVYEQQVENGNTDTRIVHMFGFFDEVPKFGEYYVFMCEEKTFNSKRKYMIRRQIYQKDSLPDLDMALLRNIYTRESSERLSDVEIDLCMERYSRALRAEHTRAISTHQYAELPVINLLDAHMPFDLDPLFRQIFVDSAFLQKKFVHEIGAFFDEHLCRALRTCEPQVLLNLFIRCKRRPFTLCFEHEYPSQIVALVSRKNEPFSLDYEQALALSKVVNISLPEHAQEMIDVYRSLIFDECHVQLHAYMNKRTLEKMNKDTLRALVKHSILVGVYDEKQQCTLHYPASVHTEQQVILNFFSKFWKNQPNSVPYSDDVSVEQCVECVRSSALTLVSSDARADIAHVCAHVCTTLGQQECLVLVSNSSDLSRVWNECASVHACTLYSVIVHCARGKRAEKCVRDVIQKLEQENKNFELTDSERLRFQDTCVYKYLCTKRNGERKMALLLHALFIGRVSMAQLRAFIAYATLRCARTLLVDATHALSCSDFSRALNTLTWVNKVVVFGNSHMLHATKPDRTSIFALLVEAYPRHLCHLAHLEENSSYELRSALAPLTTNRVDELSPQCCGEPASHAFTIVERQQYSSTSAIREHLKSVLMHIDKHDMLRAIDECTVFCHSRRFASRVNEALFTLYYGECVDAALARDSLDEDTWWTRDNIFSSLSDFCKLRERMLADTYDAHQFYVGEQVLFTRNHNGCASIRYCPLTSDEVFAGLIDRIEFIVDYDPVQRSISYRLSTREIVAHKNVRRFLVLKRSARVVCIDFYSLQSIERTFALLDSHVSSVCETSIVFVERSPPAEHVTASRVYSALACARSRALLVCAHDNVDSDIEHIFARQKTDERRCTLAHSLTRASESACTEKV